MSQVSSIIKVLRQSEHNWLTCHIKLHLRIGNRTISDSRSIGGSTSTKWRSGKSITSIRSLPTVSANCIWMFVTTEHWSTSKIDWKEWKKRGSRGSRGYQYGRCKSLKCRSDDIEIDYWFNLQPVRKLDLQMERLERRIWKKMQARTMIENLKRWVFRVTES